jgi:hypothetical protein
MRARQEFDDGGGFAMPPNPQHDAVIGPFHGAEFTGFRCRAQPSKPPEMTAGGYALNRPLRVEPAFMR